MFSSYWITVAVGSPKAPMAWVVGDEITPLWSEIDRFNELQRSYRNKQKELSNIFAELAANEPSILLFAPAETVIGVRTPELRKLAREFYKRSEASEFLKILPHGYYEENNLHGFLIETLRDYNAKRGYFLHSR